MVHTKPQLSAMSTAASSLAGVTATAPFTSSDEAVDWILRSDTYDAVKGKLLPRLIATTALQNGAVLSEPLQGGAHPLEMLDFAQHSLGALHILAALLRATPVDRHPMLFGYVRNWVTSFDVQQARLSGHEVDRLARWLQDSSNTGADAKAGVGLLRDLIWRYSPSPSIFTSLHPIYIYACLRTREYGEAAELLDHDLTDVDKQLSPIRYSDNLEYFYYGGMIYTALKMYKRAIDFFETVVSSPGTSVSAIQMDAYKKLILVQLIDNGKTSPVPKYTSSVVTSAFKSIGRPYLMFAKAYDSESWSEMKRLPAIADENAEAFLADRNIGLVKQALGLVRLRRVQQLGKSYTRLPMDRVARLLDMPPGPESERLAEIEVQGMIEVGMLQASIESPSSGSGPPVIVYQEPSENFNSLDTITRLEAEMRAAMAIQEIVRQQERALGKSKEFLQKQSQPKPDSSGIFGAYGATEGYESYGQAEWDEDVFG